MKLKKYTEHQIYEKWKFPRSSIESKWRASSTISQLNSAITRKARAIIPQDAKTTAKRRGIRPEMGTTATKKERKTTSQPL